MHILVIGGTGPSGIAFVEAALEAGHELTIYARSPRKLSSQVLNDNNVHVVEGTFEDESAIERAVDGGAEAIVSCAGPIVSLNYHGTPVTDFYARLYKIIRAKPKNTIKRCLVLSTGSYPSDRDSSSFKWTIGILFIRIVLNFAYTEIRALSKLTTEQPTNVLQWTLFRVPVLTNFAARPVQEGFKGDGMDGLVLSRKGLAGWLVAELKHEKWIGQAPMLSDSTWL